MLDINSSGVSLLDINQPNDAPKHAWTFSQIGQVTTRQQAAPNEFSVIISGASGNFLGMGGKEQSWKFTCPAPEERTKLLAKLRQFKVITFKNTQK